MSHPRFHLYACPQSLTAQRVVLALGARGTALDLQSVPANQGDKPVLTVLAEDGQKTVLCDSLAMIELVEDLHPDQPLHPRHADRLSLHRELMALALHAEPRLAALISARNSRDLDLAHHFLHQALTPLEQGIEANPGVLRQPLSNLDVVLAPLLWRVLVLDGAFKTYVMATLPRLAERGRWLLRQAEVAALLDDAAGQEFLATNLRPGAAISADAVDWSRALGAAGHEKRNLRPRPVRAGATRSFIGG
ncbi:MAG: hypothetical protein QM656_02435 [Paracoccaceae bacterium]